MNTYERAWVRLTQYLIDLNNAISYDFSGNISLEDRDKRLTLIRQIEHQMQTIEIEEAKRFSFERPTENYDDLLRIKKNDAEGSDGV